VLDAPAQLGGVVQRAVGELDEAAELRRLRKENTQLLMENDILKKAAVILGTHTQPQGKPAR
jgi:transposase